MSESSMRAVLADYLAVRRALGFKLARNELLLDTVHRVLRASRRSHGHRVPGAGMGDLPGRGVPVVVGDAAVGGPRLRRLVAGHRPSD